MKLNKNLYLLLVISALVTGCGADKETVVSQPKTTITNPTTEPKASVEEPKVLVEEEKQEEEIRDLGGLVVTIANWANQTEPEVKASAQEEALWEYRHEMMEKHNFSFEIVALGDSMGMLELFSTSTMADEPVAEIFRIQASQAGAAMTSGLAYDVSNIETIDWSDPRWSQSLMNSMSIGDASYGFVEMGGASNILYFNKRVLEEAGLDVNILYDLQASGEWTWDKFMEISQAVTRDTDNDGITDIYTLPMKQSTFAQIAVFSNGGSYVAKDENGKFYNNTLDPKSLKGFEWAAEYFKTGFGLVPEHWNGHKELFLTGKTAMYLGAQWECSSLAEAMEDDFGVVAFPKGPDLDYHVAVYNNSPKIIPNTYTQEEVEDILFAFNIWYALAPGYDGPDDWKLGLYSIFSDERAIDETITMLKENRSIITDLATFISGDAKTSQAVDDMFFNGTTPSEALEAQAPIWQSAIDKLNKD